MANLSPEILKKLARCLEEEETDVYTLSLYSMDVNDLDFFQESDREKIKNIFKILKEDTRRHAELLELVIEMGSS